MRTRFAAVFVAALFLLTPFISTGVFAASDYPNRAITIIVPFPAGGVTDLAARTVADAMEKHLKQPVVVMNKVGGGTTIGGYAVASAKPDGYTLGYFPMAASLPEAFEYFQEAPYTSKDLRPVSGVIEVVMAAAVKEDAPWNSFKELIEYARKNPGLKIGTGGKQTLQHMFLSILNRTAKTGFVGVPFAGDPQNLAAVLGGHTSVFFGDYSAVSAVAGAKKVKVLAVVAEKRPDFAPHVPTVGELGYPCKFVSILGLVGPRGLPNEMVTKIETLVGTICTEPDFQMKIRNATMQIHYKNAAAYQSHLATYKEYVVEFFKEEGLVKK